MVRLVLFDIDGTLIMTGGAGVRAFGQAFVTEFGIENATSRLNFAGRTDSSLIQEAFDLHGIAASPANFNRFFDAYVHWLEHLLPTLDGQRCPGVGGFIDECKRLPKPPRLGLLTGNIRLAAEIKLRHFELWEHFEFGAFGDDHHDRNQLARIAHQRGSRILSGELSGDEILVVGDTPRDIECGQTIQARVLAVATGNFTSEALEACKPTWVVKNLASVSPTDFCR
jgi:phosphoglycolate phosphatase